MQNVMASAAEAEIGAMCINGQEGSHMQNTLAEIGHPQVDPTPMTIDNQVAVSFGQKKSNRSDQKQSTCASTGYRTKFAKKNT